MTHNTEDNDERAQDLKSMDEHIEGWADLIATKWSALFTRLTQRDFTREEAFDLLRQYVTASTQAIDIDLAHTTYVEDEE